MRFRRKTFRILVMLLVVLPGAACDSSLRNAVPDERRSPTASRSSKGTPAHASPVVEHLDAHDGGIAQFGDSFYLYGTSYDCGFEWNVRSTRFCGFNVYTSSDLRTWTKVGQVFDPMSGDWQHICMPGGCFRPHVVFNPGTSRYVLWFNVFSGSYRVLTGPTPTGPCTLQSGAGTVAQPSGDENLFVDSDGTGYLIRTDLRGRQATDRSHELVIERLDEQYLRPSGGSSRPPVGFVEAPTMWKRKGTYYLAYSDPACPYCTGTGTSVMRAPDPLGPWSKPASISKSSCSGNPPHVSSLTIGDAVVDLYQSDQWVRLGSDPITLNQASATQTWVIVSYGPDGKVRDLTCPSHKVH